MLTLDLLVFAAALASADGIAWITGSGSVQLLKDNVSVMRHEKDKALVMRHEKDKVKTRGATLDASQESDALRRRERLPTSLTSNWPNISAGDVCLGTLYAGKKWEKVYNITGPKMQRYANRHGYKFMPISMSPKSNRTYFEVIDTVWLSMLEGFARGCTWVAMVDVDAVIVNEEVPLDPVFNGAKYDSAFAIKYDGPPDNPARPLGGFRAIRNSSYGREFVSRLRRSFWTVDSQCSCPNKSKDLIEGPCRHKNITKPSLERHGQHKALEQASMQCAFKTEDQRHVYELGTSDCKATKHTGAGGIFIKGALSKNFLIQLWGQTVQIKIKDLPRLHDCQAYNESSAMCTACGL
mmetsp:Transcript_125862/g.228393  ORF Transcript_125862/g.228393 Transcript_125862/m.228393 type:complete len:352 (+) Transcript_125862:66-1121(+)